mmetsp:Transcript_136308/g.237011  ORF Transcript_136308/g.237011 Transcript_136308/m.237011 type:complete len:257 (-) Transcript_136308:121-891(-)
MVKWSETGTAGADGVIYDGGVVKEGKGTRISKYVGKLNWQGWLNAPIMFAEVSESFSMMGESAALALLDELKAKAANVKDPTKWLKAAAARRASADAEGRTKRYGAEKVRRTIGWMNQHGGLKEPLMYKEVCDLLMSVGDSAAGRLLKALDDQKETINNPTKWLISAAKREGGSGGDWSGSSQQMGGSKSISKTIGWMNQNTLKENPITFNKVIGPLMAMGEEAAGKLLHEFGEKAHTIQDPTKWIAAAATRYAAW